MKIAILCVCFLALIQTFLGLAVSFCRRRYKLSAGCPDDPAHPMFRIRTAFSNCAEWHPMFMALMLLNGMYVGQAWTIWLYPAVIAARCFLVAGLVTAPMNRPNAFRLIGATLTFLLALILVGLLLSNFFS